MRLWKEKKEMSACVWMCVRQRKWKGGKGSWGWNQGSRCRGMKSRLRWRGGEGDGGVGACVCESMGTDAWFCIPVSARHKHTSPHLQAPSNSLAVAQTGWQRSKALPLNHIKVSLVLHSKSIQHKKNVFKEILRSSMGSWAAGWGYVGLKGFKFKNMQGIVIWSFAHETCAVWKMHRQLSVGRILNSNLHRSVSRQVGKVLTTGGDKNK